VLTEREIEEDGDEGAAEIYAIEDEVVAFVSTDVARAIVDLNRATDDRRSDGVVKTHTCWNVPVYDPFPPEGVIDALLERYYHPYHAELTRKADPELRLAVDCHTMAAQGPPVGPDPGSERPQVCLSNADGTCPQSWIEDLAAAFRGHFPGEVTVNRPFRGGYITRTHASEMPWVQLELTRAPFMSNRDKRHGVLGALTDWCSATGSQLRSSGRDE
jgi:N-formylglutamate amidohydrolase